LIVIDTGSRAIALDCCLRAIVLDSRSRGP
jgi:hypothetical protein